MVIFLDTYAMIEIAKGNHDYQKFADSASITTRFNLAELYFYFLKTTDEATADSIYNRFKDYEIFATDKIIKEAMKLKLANAKKRLSFADCIGYIAGMLEESSFLTGDYQFKDMENVEFVR